MTQKPLLIFDLDGTLIDSVPDLASATNFALNQLGLPTLQDDVIRTFVGNGAKALINRAISHCYGNSDFEDGLTDVGLGYFFEFYRKNACVNTVLYKGVSCGLRTLSDNGFDMCIVTNKPYEFVPPILKALQIESFFKMVLGGDSLDTKKPSPTPLLYVCKTLGFLPEQAIMIGDSKNDILAGKQANILTIGLSYGYNYNEPITKYNPDWVFEDFGAMVGFLTDGL